MASFGRLGRVVFGITAAVLALSPATAWAAKDLVMDVKRDALNLNGTWERLMDHEGEALWRWEAATKLPGWKQVEVPGPLEPGVRSKDQEGVKCIWARRKFTVTKGEAGRAAALKWNGIQFGATIWINGEKAGEYPCIGPWTSLLRAGLLRAGENEVVMKVTGWAGVARGKSGFILIPAGASNTQSWGSKDAAIIDDVWLEFYDRVYMKSVLAIPNVKDGKVTLRVWFDGTEPPPGTMELETTLVGPGKWGIGPVTTKHAVTNVEKGGKPVDFEVAVANARLWTPDTPELYTVRLSLASGGKRCDAAEFRFGMREITIVDGHYRLNGKPFWLHGSNMVGEWNWGEVYAENAKRYLVEEARLMNLGCFRTHAAPVVTSWADIADENGMMFLSEMSVLVNTFDFQFTREEWGVWQRNVLLNSDGLMRKLWNHPSIIMWVLSNESRYAAWESGEFFQFVRGLDPTRPAMRASSTTAEVVDVHTCSNIRQGADGWVIVQLKQDLARRDPTRTLGNSEYMNDGSLEHSLRWFGQAGLREQAEMMYAQLGTEHTEAMRRMEFDLILPYMYAGWTSFRRQVQGRTWRDPYPTVMAAGLHSSMAPVLASLDQFDRDYVSGTEVETPVVFINELHRDVAATVDVYVTPRNPEFLPDAQAVKDAVWKTRLERTFKADSLVTESVRWKVPGTPGTYWLAAVVTRAGDRPVVSQREVRSVADPEPAKRLKGIKLVVLGGDAEAVKWLTEAGARVGTTVRADLGAGSTIVVWNAGAVAVNERPTAEILEHVRRGGRLVILDQPKWDWTELMNLKVTALGSWELYGTSNAFVCKGMEKHELLAGVDPQSLRRWNSLPGAVAEFWLDATAMKEAKPILWAVETEKIVGLSQTLGRGEIVACQLQVRSRLTGKAYDPVAVRVLLNLLAPGTGK